MSQKQVQKALRRAKTRDKKRQTKMAITGKSVFTLARLKADKAKKP